MRRSFPLVALLALLVVAPSVARGQFGRGLPEYRIQGTRAYQFGFKPTYEILVVNASLQDLEFRLTRHQDESQRWTEPNVEWVVPAGTFGTTGVLALAMEGTFLNRRGVEIPVEPHLGAYYATFVIDEEKLREYESRNERGAVVIRTFGEGERNPDIEEVRLTRHTPLLARVLREARLLPTIRERPGPKGEFLEFGGGGFPKEEQGLLGVPDPDEIEKVATTGRIRQPGEEFVTIEVLRADGDPAAGARFGVRIGHDLAYRTETGTADGEGRIKFFTTRDRNIGMHLTISDTADAPPAEFTIAPSRDLNFRIRLR